jgi:NitT/TauT family transport system substrate-binding protein
MEENLIIHKGIIPKLLVIQNTNPMKHNLCGLLLAISCLLAFSTQASSEKIRIAALAYGTANWELEAIKQAGIDKKLNLELEITKVASPQAGKIALQAGSADLIISDWIWVSRQRFNNINFTFAPYSSTHGALMVPADSDINSLADLAGKKLGIAGGGLDKNWILLRALALQKLDLDLDKSATKVFAAPPLLNQQLLQNRLDALMNYWHYAARLEAKGYRRLLDANTILSELGIKETVPALGYVFQENWGNKHKAAVLTFLKATEEAKTLLCESNEAWNNIKHLTKAGDSETENMLRYRYCEGRIKSWGEQEVKAADKIFSILHQFGGKKLVGKSTQLNPGTFWTSAFIKDN